MFQILLKLLATLVKKIADSLKTFGNTGQKFGKGGKTATSHCSTAGKLKFLQKLAGKF
jgi:hypothetical protein